jgi:hypothetical protein
MTFTTFRIFGRGEARLAPVEIAVVA